MFHEFKLAEDKENKCLSLGGLRGMVSYHQSICLILNETGFILLDHSAIGNLLKT